MDPRPGVSGLMVQADAAKLPFADRKFAGIVSNHSLEHIHDYRSALREIGRVIAKNGALVVSVPDASTFTDRLYRWLSQGGGHVNAFTDADALAAEIAELTGLPCVARRTLYSSLSFLNRANSPRPIPKRLWLLGGGYEWTLLLYNWLSRRIDRRFGLRSSIYGWALYFGSISETIDTRAWSNVCLRCGSGDPAESLQAIEKELVSGYRCRSCGCRNPYCCDL